MHMGIHVVALDRGPVNCGEGDGIGGRKDFMTRWEAIERGEDKFEVRLG
jgi:hypothetical protein